MAKKDAQATTNGRLRAARQERGWTQQQLADLIGAPQALNVTRWERGIAFPSAYYIQKLSQVFGKSPRELGLLRSEGETDEQKSASADTLWQVPYRRNPFFTGREDLLQLLRQQLSNGSPVALTQAYAFSGLGGIGKTQLALEYAYRSRQDYRAVFWVRASSRETFVADVVALAGLLELPEQDARATQQIVTAVKDWLARHENWLLILDNADDLSLVTDILPSGGNGHLLLTTRSSATGNLAVSVPVERMEAEEGSLLLLRRAKLLPSHTLPTALEQSFSDDVLTIVRAVDGLPLALEQAGAYIEESGCSLAEYLELYQRNRRSLLARGSIIPTDYPYTVASTWALSFEQVEQQNRAAAELLRLCAFLDPDAIPEALVREGAAHLGLVLLPVAANPFLLNEALQALRSFSLLRRNPQTKMLSLHRLVQVIIQDEMDDETRRGWIERVVRLLKAVFPEPSMENFKQWPRCQELLSHVQVCADLIERHRLVSLDAAHLLKTVALYLALRLSNESLAHQLAEQALHIYEQLGYHDHTEIADLLNTLGTLSWSQSHYEQAASFYQRSLDIRQRILGNEHVDTAASYNNLAMVSWNQAQYAQAEQLYQQALAVYERAFGPDHPKTADVLTNIGALYYHQERYEEAVACHKRALAIREQVLDPGHPYLGQSLQNLGEIYYVQCRYEEAEALLLRALLIREQALGTDRLVGATLHNLAQVYEKQGRTEEAEATYRRALAIREQQVGGDHPEVAETLVSLAVAYAAQGRHEEAGSLLRRALSIREQALGPQHPDTLAVRSLYRTWQQEQQQPGRSIQEGAQPRTVHSQRTVPASPAGLSAREVEVLSLVAQGLTNPQVAERLMLSEKTVANHLTRIFKKIGCPNRAAAVAFAMRHGIT